VEFGGISDRGVTELNRAVAGRDEAGRGRRPRLQQYPMPQARADAGGRPAPEQAAEFKNQLCATTSASQPLVRAFEDAIEHGLQSFRHA
jgi:hypothetical protein